MSITNGSNNSSNLELKYDLYGSNPVASSKRFRNINSKTQVEALTGSISTITDLSNYGDYKIDAGLLNNLRVMTTMSYTPNLTPVVDELVITIPITHIEVMVDNKVVQTFTEKNIIDFNYTLAKDDVKVAAMEQNLFIDKGVSGGTPLTAFTETMVFKLPFGANLTQQQDSRSITSMVCDVSARFVLRVHYKVLQAKIMKQSVAGVAAAAGEIGVVSYTMPAIYREYGVMSGNELDNIIASYSIPGNEFQYYGCIQLTKEFTSSGTGTATEVKIETLINGQNLVCGIVSVIEKDDIDSRNSVGEFGTASGFADSGTNIRGLQYPNSGILKSVQRENLGTVEAHPTYIFGVNDTGFFDIATCGCRYITETAFGFELTGIYGLQASTNYVLHLTLLTVNDAIRFMKINKVMDQAAQTTEIMANTENRGGIGPKQRSTGRRRGGFSQTTRNRALDILSRY